MEIQKRYTWIDLEQKQKGIRNTINRIIQRYDIDAVIVGMIRLHELNTKYYNTYKKIKNKKDLSKSIYNSYKHISKVVGKRKALMGELERLVTYNFNAENKINLYKPKKEYKRQLINTNTKIKASKSILRRLNI